LIRFESAERTALTQDSMEGLPWKIHSVSAFTARCSPGEKREGIFGGERVFVGGVWGGVGVWGLGGGGGGGGGSGGGVVGGVEGGGFCG